MNFAKLKLEKFFPVFSLATFLLCSCTGTVKNLVNTPEFMVQNQPRRVLKVMVVTETKPDVDEITQWLDTCSQAIDEQVGISLKPTKFVQVQNLPSANEISRRLGTLNSIGENYNDWDMIINLTKYDAADIMVGMMNMFVPVPMIQGYIDDSNRRIIVVKSKDYRTFVHEFFHAFIFSHDHSDGGVMSAMTIQLLPFTPPVNGTLYLNETDRNEVLKNKWRHFRKDTQTKLSLKAPVN